MAQSHAPARVPPLTSRPAGRDHGAMMRPLLALCAASLLFVPACEESADDSAGLSGGNNSMTATATATETDAGSSGSGSGTSEGTGLGSGGGTGSSGNASSTGGPGSSGTTSTSTSTSSTSGGGTCGNGQIEANEQCDGANLGGYDCVGLGYAGGTLSCDPVTCTFDTSMCMAGSGGTGG